MTASAATCQTPTVCTPREQAAKNADSLRTLPVVRTELAACRLETQALGLKLDVASGRAGRFEQAATGLRTDLSQCRDAYQVQGAELLNWRRKARARGWVIGGGLGGIGLLTLLAFVHP